MPKTEEECIADGVNIIEQVFKENEKDKRCGFITEVFDPHIMSEELGSMETKTLCGKVLENQDEPPPFVEWLYCPYCGGFMASCETVVKNVKVDDTFKFIKDKDNGKESNTRKSKKDFR